MLNPREASEPAGSRSSLGTRWWPIVLFAITLAATLVLLLGGGESDVEQPPRVGEAAPTPRLGTKDRPPPTLPAPPPVSTTPFAEDPRPERDPSAADLTIEVRDARNGFPVPSWPTRVRAAGAGSGQPPTDCRSDESGVIFIGGLPPGDYTIEAGGTFHCVVSLEAGSRLRVRIDVQTPSHCIVSVEEGDGSPLGSARVLLFLGGHELPLTSIPTNDAGIAEFGIPAGSVLLGAEANGYVPSARRLEDAFPETSLRTRFVLERAKETTRVRVIDSRGAALPAAEVRYRFDVRRRPAAASADRGLDPAVSTVRTDDCGRATLPFGRTELTEITVCAAGRASVVVPRELLDPIPTDAEIVVTMDDLKSLRGRVMADDGTPIPAAAICWLSVTSAAESRSVTDHDGRFSIPIGNETSEFLVSAAGFARRRISCRSIDPSPSAPPFDVVLEPRALCAITLVDSTEVPIAGAVVVLRRRDGGRFDEFRATTDDDGRCSFGESAAVEHELRVLFAGQDSVAVTPNTVTLPWEGRVRTSLPNSELRWARITGRVSGNCPDGAVVVLRRRGAREGVRVPVRPTDGSFESPSLEAGSYVMMLLRGQERYAWFGKFDFDAKADQDLGTWAITEPGWLGLTTTLENLRIEILRDEEQLFDGTISGSGNPRGRTVALPAGPCQLRWTLPDGSTHSRTVLVRPGASELVELPAAR